MENFLIFLFSVVVISLSGVLSPESVISKVGAEAPPLKTGKSKKKTGYRFLKN